MAENSIRAKAKITDDIVHVKLLIKHAMTAGKQNNSQAQFIQEVNCEHNGNLVFKANWSTAIAKNPYLSFQFEGAQTGDSITINWLDNLGDSDNKTITIG